MSEARRPFLTAQWRNVIVLSFPVDPGWLRDRVPVGTTLDSWQGQTLVSVVGFQFRDTKVLGVPMPFHRCFEEVNLRFYVRRVTNGEVRPGVVFIRELVPRRIVCRAARFLYREPYRVVPMRTRMIGTEPPAVEYRWDAAGRWSTLAAAGGGAAAIPERGTLEEFLTVRHWGYNGARGKTTLEYRVDHPRWKVWHAADTRVDYSPEVLCGGDLARALKGMAPMSQLIADGSAVAVHWRAHITG